MSYSEVLTLPNLRDKLQPEVLQRVDQILADLRVELRPLTMKVLFGVKHVKNALYNKRKELAAIQKLIRILHEEYHAGHLDNADEELCLDRYNLDLRYNTLTTDTLVLKSSGQEIEGRIRNDIEAERRNWSVSTSAYVEEAYLDSLIAPYKTPEGAKIPLFAAKDDTAEQKFRQNVLKAYGAKRGELAWCVVSGQWHNAKDMTVLEIALHCTGEPVAQDIFGPSDNEEGHLMGAKNGLPMHRIYKRAFRDSQMVLVPKGGPDDDQGSFSRWKILLWDEFESSDGTAKSGRTKLPYFGPELDGRVLKHQKSEAPGWWRTCFDDNSASKGPKIVYVRTSLLRGLAPKLGHLTKEEAIEFAAHTTFPRAPDDSDEDQGFEAVDEETMDAFLADNSDGPGAVPTSPLTVESDDSMDDIEIDGEIDIGEDSEEWEDLDDEYEWGDAWVDVDENINEYADEDDNVYY
ncbi:hypothetical protein MKX08_003418 [Trichoderma sp. CBMAI-0020]|nr:hypothetical protein MKX08_003418 [Trichoderma sp. CBMAI-0020]